MHSGGQRAEGRAAESQGPQGRQEPDREDGGDLAHPDVGIHTLWSLQTGHQPTSTALNGAPSGSRAGVCPLGGCSSPWPGGRWPAFPGIPAFPLLPHMCILKVESSFLDPRVRFCFFFF